MIFRFRAANRFIYFSIDFIPNADRGCLSHLYDSPAQNRCPWEKQKGCHDCIIASTWHAVQYTTRSDLSLISEVESSNDQHEREREITDVRSLLASTKSSSIYPLVIVEHHIRLSIDEDSRVSFSIQQKNERVISKISAGNEYKIEDDDGRNSWVVFSIDFSLGAYLADKTENNRHGVALTDDSGILQYDLTLSLFIEFASSKTSED